MQPVIMYVDNRTENIIYRRTTFNFIMYNECKGSYIVCITFPAIMPGYERDQQQDATEFLNGLI